MPSIHVMSVETRSPSELCYFVKTIMPSSISIQLIIYKRMLTRDNILICNLMVQTNLLSMWIEFA